MFFELIQHRNAGKFDIHDSIIKVHAHPLGNVLLSQDPAVQVPSALEGLTVVFGMGTRGSPPPSSPNGLSYAIEEA